MMTLVFVLNRRWANRYYGERHTLMMMSAPPLNIAARRGGTIRNGRRAVHRRAMTITVRSVR
jgi:hypothetical protein